MSTSPPEETAHAARMAANQRSWRQAFDLYRQADEGGDLDVDDLEQWSTAAYLLGHVDDAIAALTRASRMLGNAEAWERMCVSMYWIVFMLLNRGDMAQVSGWTTRAQPTLDRLGPDSRARGYFACLAGFRNTAIEGNFGEGERLATEAIDLGRHSGDSDLLTLGLNIRGRSLIRMGRRDEGITHLDEAMVEIISGAVSPIPAGTVYCSVIDSCEEVGDIRRAREWTEALDLWCSRQGDMVTFTGRCLMHRSFVLTRRGEWAEAVAEAQRACERLTGAADEISSGRVHYQLGELARMRGDLAQAESEFRAAADWGHDPQPGLALMRLTQGRQHTAAAMMRRLHVEKTADHERTAFLPAMAQIMVEIGDVDTARQAAIELRRVSGTFGTETLTAEADRAEALVRLAEGDSIGALALLRAAFATWRGMGAPFEEAQTRLLIARTCREIGDDETAQLEADAAERSLRSMRGTGDGPSGSGSDDAHRLSPRELEVLQMLTTGITNQEVADRLFLSVRTVDRHVANILTKLGVQSRTAATAYAYEHHLV